MTADERRGVILDIICARRYETIDNLAFELDASRRTIERDVLHLSLRFPIYSTKGHGGGILISDDFRWSAKYLSSEQLALFNNLGSKLKGKDAEIMFSIIKMFSMPQRKDSWNLSSEPTSTILKPFWTRNAENCQSFSKRPLLSKTAQTFSAGW